MIKVFSPLISHISTDFCIALCCTDKKITMYGRLLLCQHSNIQLNLQEDVLRLSPLSLAHSFTSDWLLAMIPYDRDDPQRVYTVEYRTPRGEDLGSFFLVFTEPSLILAILC